MKAEEKAKELTQKYFDEVTDHMTWEQAQQCALICAEECKKCCMVDGKILHSNQPAHNEDFWSKVISLLEQ